MNHPKTSKFNKAFEFSVISSYYSYNIHKNMFLLISHYPDFLITSCIHVFENYVQSIVFYGLRVYAAAIVRMGKLLWLVLFFKKRTNERKGDRKFKKNFSKIKKKFNFLKSISTKIFLTAYSCSHRI